MNIVLEIQHYISVGLMVLMTICFSLNIKKFYGPMVSITAPLFLATMAYDAVCHYDMLTLGLIINFIVTLYVVDSFKEMLIDVGIGGLSRKAAIGQWLLGCVAIGFLLVFLTDVLN